MPQRVFFTFKLRFSFLFLFFKVKGTFRPYTLLIFPLLLLFGIHIYIYFLRILLTFAHTHSEDNQPDAAKRLSPGSSKRRSRWLEMQHDEAVDIIPQNVLRIPKPQQSPPLVFHRPVNPTFTFYHPPNGAIPISVSRPLPNNPLAPSPTQTAFPSDPGSFRYVVRHVVCAGQRVEFLAHSHR